MGGSDAIEDEIRVIAARQHGLVARRQLIAAGLGEDAIEHPLATKRLLRLRRGVYAVGHAELRRETPPPSYRPPPSAAPSNGPSRPSSSTSSPSEPCSPRSPGAPRMPRAHRPA